MSTFFTRLTSGVVLVLALPAIVAAAAQPNPEQQIADRRMTVSNGTQVGVHYRVDGLSPFEAARYQALEFAENQVKKVQDVQDLGRLYDRNETRVALMQAPSLTIYPNGVAGGPRYGRGAVPASAAVVDTSNSAYYTPYQAFTDVERTYLDVLNMERARQGLPPVGAEAVPVPAAAANAQGAAPQANANASVTAQPNASDALIAQIVKMQQANADAFRNTLANADAFRQVAANPTPVVATAATPAAKPPVATTPVAFGSAAQDVGSPPQALVLAPLGGLLALAGFRYLLF